MSLTSDDRPVLIIGAGIAGLTLACTLQHHKIAFKIYDAQAADHAQGYGITLRTWAYDHFLEDLGVEHNTFLRETATDSADGLQGYIDGTVKDIHTGHTVVSIGSADDAFRANRNLLRQFLLKWIDASQIFFKKTLQTVTTSGDAVEASFADGETVVGRLLVAADGVYSQVRSSQIPSVHPTLLDARVYNGHVQISRSDFDARIRPGLGRTNILAAVTDHAMVGLSISCLTSTAADISWFYTASTRLDEDGKGSTIKDNEHHLVTREEMISHVQKLEPLSEPFLSVFSRPLLERSVLYHWPMRTVRIPFQNLVSQVGQSSIAFIGDAAHAMPIFAGEGGNHGLQDGHELGKALAEASRSTGALQDAVLKFYDTAYERWQTAITKSEARMHALHRPMVAWRTSRT